MKDGMREKITALLFILILAGVFIFNFAAKDKDFSPEENRMLQERPKFSISTYLDGRFESHFESYANDQFLMRNQFIRIKSAMDVTAGKLEANGVYRAKDNYLMEDIVVPDEENLTKTELALKEFKKRYPKVKMYFLLAPNSANILSDKLPRTVKVADQNAQMDSFFAGIEESGYKPVDVREALLENKDDVQLYYRTDHHWTTDGAYVAYIQAAKVMKLGAPVTFEPYVVKTDFNGTMYSRSGFTNGKSDAIKIYLPKDRKKFKDSVIYYSDTQEKTTAFYQVDNLATKDAYSVFGGSNHPLYTIKTPVKGGRHLLVVKDSYANSFIPFLTQHYQEIVVVDPRYYFENIDELMSVEGITDVLFLYNANTFFADDSLSLMLTEQGPAQKDK